MKIKEIVNNNKYYSINLSVDDLISKYKNNSKEGLFLLKLPIY